ncbi:MAG: nucleoside diphosphate kinase regulator [Gemmatimonadaceae bacterium]
MLHHHNPLLPHIVVSETEERRLTTLATASELLRRNYDVAHTLLAELERADVVPDDRMPVHVVRMNSIVEFMVDGRASPRVELVFPRDANIGEGRISILTPIGTALLGLSPGQSMPVLGNDGKEHQLTVVAIYDPPPRAVPAAA